MNYKIYIAGFDVFKTDAIKISNDYKSICLNNGHQGLFPFDKNVDFSLSNDVIRDTIYKNNIEMIKDCDVVIANGNNFRGSELDSGTAFEIGYAKALNKKVIIYMDSLETYLEKFIKKNDVYSEVINEKTTLTYSKEDGMMVEDFGYQLNIMFEDCVIVKGGFEEAIALV